MSRRLLAAAAVAAVAVVAGGAALGLTPWWGSDAGGLPTARAEIADFVRRVPADGHLEAVRATPLTVPREVGGAVRIAWIVPDGSRVEAGDPVVRFDPTDMEKSLITAREQLATTDVKVGKEKLRTGSEVANLERDAEMAERELTTAERFAKRDEFIYSRSEIIESEIDGELATAKRDHALEAQEARGELGERDLELLEIERRKARLEMDEAERGLAALEVTAPHDGIAVLTTDWLGNPPRVGDTTWPGRPVAEIPELSEMQAEVWVLEADAGGLAAGQRATVWIEAHPETAHPAVVERVDSLAKPRLRGSPVQYFGAVLRLESTDPQTMKPGQRLRAVIEVEAREGALVVPRQALFERHGERVVFRRRDGRFEPVTVTVGPATPALAVIEAGLEAGDEVALADPERRPAADGEPAGGATPGAVPGLGGGGGSGSAR